MDDNEVTMEDILFRDQLYELWTLLAQTRDAMSRARQQELRRYNISNMQAATLFYIQALGKQATPAKISAWILRKRHTISELLSRMEKSGLVRKIKDLPKKNQIRFVLTEKGRQKYYQSSKRESIYRILSCVSEEERQQLRSCLQKLLQKSLEELAKK